MRQVSDIPAGTMHLLVCHAIESAAAINCPRVSLAAAPCGEATEPGPVAWTRRRLLDASQTDGLRRFKACFDPHWSRLYAAAPTRASLTLGLWTIYAHVNRVNRAGSTSNS
jgi:phosphatidylglycerol lysyltransferase